MLESEDQSPRPGSIRTLTVVRLIFAGVCGILYGVRSVSQNSQSNESHTDPWNTDKRLVDSRFIPERIKMTERKQPGS